MESVGSAYILIHLYTYVIVTIEEKKVMGLRGSERIIWNVYGKNWREEGKRVNGVTVFQFLKYKLSSRAVKMNFTMSQHLDTGENRAVHPPRHHLRAGAVLSSVMYSASQLAICSRVSAFRALIQKPLSDTLGQGISLMLLPDLFMPRVFAILSNSVFSTSLSYKRKEKPKVEHW